MKNFIYKVKSAFLSFFGDLKYFRYPPCIVWHPTTFLAKGTHTREAINILRAGDIILRKYNCYLDGLFIPGKYSHTGIFIGNDSVIHAIAEGVESCDVIDFLRCDGFCVLRPSSGQENAILSAEKFLGLPYDFDFKQDNNKFYCHELVAGCYPMLEIKQIIPKFLGGLIKGNRSYLAESFLESPDFSKLYEFFPR